MGVLDQFWGGLSASFGKSLFGGLKLRTFSQRRGSKLMGDLLMSGGSMGYPGLWTSDRLEQVRHFKGWTYVAIKAICEEVACNPPLIAKVGSRDEEQQKKLLRYGPMSRRKSMLSTVGEHEDLEPVDSNHPLAELLRNPNEPDVSFDFWYETFLFLELTGNSYWWVIPNRLGLPAELWVLPSHWVWPISDRGKMVDHYEIRPYGSAGASRAMELPADEVIAFKYKNPFSKIDGYSPLSGGAEWVDTSESIDATRWHSFKNGLWPGMVVTLDGEVADPDETALNRLYARFDERLRGENKYHRPIIMPSGAQIAQMTRSPREMDFTVSGDQMRDWQMAIHRVGKTIAGITEEVNYASMVAATANFIMRTIRPKLSYVGQVATEKLARRFDPSLVVYWHDLTPDDPQQTSTDLNIDWNNDAITQNEYRALRGRPPLPDGDKTKSQLAPAALEQPGEGGQNGLHLPFPDAAPTEAQQQAKPGLKLPFPQDDQEDDVEDQVKALSKKLETLTQTLESILGKKKSLPPL